MRRAPKDCQWCPSCRRRLDTLVRDHGPDCEECGTDLVEVPLWRRTISATGVGIGVCILLGVLLGPPAMAVMKFYQGAPLLAFETVTVTRSVPSGVVVTLLPWAGLLVLVWMLNKDMRGTGWSSHD